MPLRGLPLNEDEVVAALCRELIATGFEIEQQLTTKDKGVDVIAQHPQTKVRVFVEAKGGTSCRRNSERFGKPFSSEQVFGRVARGVFTCLQLREKYSNKAHNRIVLAVPDTRQFQMKVATVATQLEAAGIEVWLAKEQV